MYRLRSMAVPVAILPFSNPRRPHDDNHWLGVQEALKELRVKLDLFKNFGLEEAEKRTGQVSQAWLPRCISAYHGKSRSRCNFNVIRQDATVLNMLLDNLPFIAEEALELPKYLEQYNGEEPSIPLLIKMKEEDLKVPFESKSVLLRRSLICSLLANAFLCTFKMRTDKYAKSLSSINFWRLYDEGTDEGRNSIKREKVKCFLSYFQKMSTREVPDTLISFERRAQSLSTPAIWETSCEKLFPLTVTSGERIENGVGMLQVDFANASVGGGVLADGCVQEEIRFSISPELVVARLFTERLAGNEVLLITGTRQFSSYQGYSVDFTWKPFQDTFGVNPEGVDDQGREATQVVAMDAVYFHESSKANQYRKFFLDRDLGKSYLGFMPGTRATGVGVATGNWGCGAFNGDPYWKLLIQWLAASLRGREVKYHTNGRQQKQEFEEIRAYLWRNREKATVRKIYELMVMYGESQSWTQNVNVFQFIRSILDNA